MAQVPVGISWFGLAWAFQLYNSVNNWSLVRRVNSERSCSGGNEASNSNSEGVEEVVMRQFLSVSSKQLQPLFGLPVEIIIAQRFHVRGLALEDTPLDIVAVLLGVKELPEPFFNILRSFGRPFAPPRARRTIARTPLCICSRHRYG